MSLKTLRLHISIRGGLTRLLAPALALAALAGRAEAQTVTVPERAEVTVDELALGDIARIDPHSEELARVPLGHSPYAGHYRWVSKSWVAQELKKWGFADVRLSMPDRIMVTRRSLLVTAAEIESAVRALFGRSQSYEVERVAVAGQAVVPWGELEITVEEPGRLVNLASAGLKVKIFTDGVFRKSIWVRASLAMVDPVAVLTRDLEIGHRIQPSDVSLEQRRIKRVGEYLRDPGQAVGKILKRGLKAGEPLVASHLRQPQAVKRGDYVTLIARGSAVAVKTMGLARSSGRVGESIAVENLSSKQTVRALITGEKQVEVSIPGAQR